MAFDQKTRNLLQRTVTACRRAFDREFTAQLQELYGIQPDGSLTPCTELDHLADDELEVARLLRSRINHLEGGEPAEALTRTHAKPEHVARVIREQAFTVLNRLAALRLCEERGLVLECVRRSVNSEGFQLFLSSAGNALGETHEAYRVYLHCVFDELALDLGVLFDRFSPLALLFPRKDALEEVLRELNGSGRAAESEVIPAEQFAEVWKADETIGWIYQYYNDEAERKKMREESSAPRNSRELAVRNQFFTPRYVVEFLTDNTLGRLWYDMTRGQTALGDRCRSLVRRPTETFLKTDESAPESPAGSDAQAEGGLSQEELLRQPVHIPHRQLKDPSEIRLLDPACGSMHFGLYAFDLFTVIYDEAWEIALGLDDDQARSAGAFAPFVTFAATFPDKAAFLLEVPRLIIERNIHGIEIDPRAAQIAGLSLWLRAQRAWHQAGVKPSGRPRITRSNVVCAEPMPGEKKLLREFVDQQFDIGERPAFDFLLQKIFDHMSLADEAGSLLRIEEEIRSAVSEARTLAETQPALKQAGLFPENEKAEPKQLDLRGMLDECFWQKAEQRIYDALEAYAEQAENGDGFQRRLFADNAAKGFAFIDLCRKRYDVVLMNPPFGEFPPSMVDYVCAKIPSGRNDIYSAMVLRFADYMMADQGRLGAITSRAFVVGRDLRDFRKALVQSDGFHLSLLLDLGAGVLDAMVETAAYVLSVETQDLLSYRDLRSYKEVERPNHIKSDGWEGIPLSVFRSTTDNQLLFGLDADSLAALQARERFIPNFADVTQGLVTEDNTRFLRLRWEVPTTEFNKTWFIFAKGGDYSWFTGDLHLAVKRPDNGKELAAFAEGKSGNVARTRQSSKFYGTPGATYSGRSQKGFSCRRLRADSCFSNKSGVVFPTGEYADKWRAVLPLVLASDDYLALIAAQSKFGSYEVGSIKLLPRPDIKLLELYNTANAVYIELDSVDQYIETSCLFVSPVKSKGHITEIWNHVISNVKEALLSAGLNLSKEVGTFLIANARSLDEDFSGIAAWISYSAGCAFGCWDIRVATGERPRPELPEPFAALPICPPGMLQGTDGLQLMPEAGRRLRSESQYPLDVAWDGILVDDPEHPLDCERYVRAAFELVWSQHGEILERETRKLPGQPTLREWLRRPSGFFADHLRRYSKSRRQAPVYWPLSTAGGGYILWLYYHRLTPDTLYKCIQQFVVPKLADVEREISRLRTILIDNEGGSRERKRLEDFEELRHQLIDFRTELELWAPKWKPNLNDGALITAAPLWKLFRLPRWQSDLKACWEEMERGDYDWSHLAYTLWPDRVREKCKRDRSLAIAHGLDDLCEVKVPVKKVRKTKLPETEDNQQELPED